MTEEQNIRVVSDIYAAFRENNYEAIISQFNDVFEMRLPGSPDLLPWARTRRTKQDVRRFFEEVASSAEVLATYVNGLFAQGDKVVAIGSFALRAKKTGREFTDDWAMTWTLRDGKVIAQQTYHDTASTAAALQS